MAVVPKIFVGVLVSFLACGSAHAAGSGDGAYRIFKPGGTDVKWGQPSLSRGATITYDFVRPGQRTKHVRNCPDIRPIDTLLRRAGIERSDFETELDRALAIWQSVANVRFRRTSPGTVAQILIGVQGRPLGRAFTDMRYVRPIAKNAPGRITGALICLNPLAEWKIGYDGNLSAYDLRYTFLHEIGHAIGLDHPGASGTVMSFRYEERFRTLQPGDIDGARYLYGMPVPLARSAGRFPEISVQTFDKGNRAAYCNPVAATRRESSLSGFYRPDDLSGLCPTPNIFPNILRVSAQGLE